MLDRATHTQTVVSGIEELNREAGVSLSESKVRPQFQALVEASNALKKAAASAQLESAPAQQVRRVTKEESTWTDYCM